MEGEMGVSTPGSVMAGVVPDEHEPVAVGMPEPRRVFIVLVAIALVFFAISVLNVAFHETGSLAARFDTADEANVPTWYSTVLWLAAAVLALIIGAAGRLRAAPGAARWLFVGGLFVLLSIDEAGQLHEETVGPLMDAVQDAGVDKMVARGVAVFIIAVVLAVIALWLWPWLKTLPRQMLVRIVLSGVIFVSGALVLEVASRLIGDYGIWDYLSPLEECCEMLGVSLLVVTLLPAVRGVLGRPVP